LIEIAKKTSFMTFYHRQLLRLAYILFLSTSCSLGYAQIRLPKVFGSNMVLQRGVAIPIWGSARPKSQIVVEIKGNRTKTTVAGDGKWKLLLPAMQAGGRFTKMVSLSLKLG
jgi:sialate O-acetylesterase